ncbi:M23 family metallopeptidase [Longispora sp. K20-0274]|uniref:M23 family metallopeptidase n=1 Tax=Longispora sp. K20-0274 TaxID=3088255 RepID=UPI003999D6FF
MAARIDAASVDAVRAGAARTDVPGKLVVPVRGGSSSGFGLRLDPYFHRWQSHAGVDLAAGAGTPILAAAAGRVVQAGWAGGYGNSVCVDHGTDRHVSTCYAHQSVVLVREGQDVRAGQILGLVGSTGAATGPHLHFEVRLNGVAVDPAPWISQ